MLATGGERLYNLISVGWRGVCPSVISERNAGEVFETGRRVVTLTYTSAYFPVTHIRQGREEYRAVLVSTCTFYVSCTLE